MNNNEIVAGTGKNRSFFLLVCGALVLNFILMLCKTIQFSMSGFTGGDYTIVGFCQKMSSFLSNFNGQTNDGPIYQALMYLSAAGIIMIALTLVLLLLPMFTGKDRPVSLKLAKISSIYSLAVNAIFFALVIGTYSQKSGVDASLTFGGVLYLMESIVLIVSVFILSGKLKAATDKAVA